jgi:hypothetical protein
MTDLEKIKLACKDQNLIPTDLNGMSDFVLNSRNVVSFTRNGLNFRVGDLCYYQSKDRKIFFILDGLRIIENSKLKFMISGTYIEDNYKSTSICYEDSLLKDESVYSII